MQMVVGLQAEVNKVLLRLINLTRVHVILIVDEDFFAIILKHRLNFSYFLYPQALETFQYVVLDGETVADAIEQRIEILLLCHLDMEAVLRVRLQRNINVEHALIALIGSRHAHYFVPVTVLDQVVDAAIIFPYRALVHGPLVVIQLLRAHSFFEVLRRAHER